MDITRVKRTPSVGVKFARHARHARHKQSSKSASITQCHKTRVVWGCSCMLSSNLVSTCLPDVCHSACFHTGVILESYWSHTGVTPRARLGTP
jgi:hypothetical protein